MNFEKTKPVLPSEKVGPSSWTASKEEPGSSPCMDTVLLIEDDLEIRELLIEALSQRNIHVMGVGTAEEAATVLENHCVSLILLDKGLPDQDGFEFCASLRRNEKTRELPVIFLTGD